MQQGVAWLRQQGSESSEYERRLGTSVVLVLRPWGGGGFGLASVFELELRGFFSQLIGVV